MSTANTNSTKERRVKRPPKPQKLLIEMTLAERVRDYRKRLPWVTRKQAETWLIEQRAREREWLRSPEGQQAMAAYRARQAEQAGQALGGAA